MGRRCGIISDRRVSSSRFVSAALTSTPHNPTKPIFFFWEFLLQKMVFQCIRQTPFSLICEVIRNRLVQVRQKTFRVGDPQSSFTISSSFIPFFLLLPFFINTKIGLTCGDTTRAPFLKSFLWMHVVPFSHITQVAAVNPDLEWFYPTLIPELLSYHFK